MNVFKKVTVNTGILYLRMGLTVFISLYSTRLILATLGEENFGLYNLVAGVIAMLTFLNTSMANTTQRFITYAEGTGEIIRLKKVFNVSVLLHLIVAITVLVILELLGQWLIEDILNIHNSKIYLAKCIFQFSIISVVLSIISVPYDAVISAHENMLVFALISILESVLRLLIILCISRYNDNIIIIYSFGMTIVSVISILMRRGYCKWKYIECKVNMRKYFDKAIFVEMSKFTGWSLLGSSSSMANSYGQGLLLNLFFGTGINAAQGICNQISGQLGSFAVTMLKALTPVIGKAEGAGQRKLMLDASIIGCKISFFLWLLFCIPVMIDMDYIFKIWLKKVPEYTIIFSKLYLIRILIDQLYVTFNSSILATGNIKMYQISYSLLTIIPLPVSYILFERGYEPYAMYIILIIYTLLTLILTLYYTYKNCNLSIDKYIKDVILRCLFVVLVVIIFSAIPLKNMGPGITRVISIFTLSTTAFFISTYFIGLDALERKNVRTVIAVGLNKLKLKFYHLQNSFN